MSKPHIYSALLEKSKYLSDIMEKTITNTENAFEKLLENYKDVLEMEPSIEDVLQIVCVDLYNSSHPLYPCYKDFTVREMEKTKFNEALQIISSSSSDLSNEDFIWFSKFLVREFVKHRAVLKKLAEENVDMYEQLINQEYHLTCLKTEVNYRGNKIKEDAEKNHLRLKEWIRKNVELTRQNKELEETIQRIILEKDNFVKSVSELSLRNLHIEDEKNSIQEKNKQLTKELTLIKNKFQKNSEKTRVEITELSKKADQLEQLKIKYEKTIETFELNEKQKNKLELLNSNLEKEKVMLQEQLDLKSEETLGLQNKIIELKQIILSLTNKVEEVEQVEEVDEVEEVGEENSIHKDYEHSYPEVNSDGVSNYENSQEDKTEPEFLHDEFVHSSYQNHHEQFIDYPINQMNPNMYYGHFIPPEHFICHGHMYNHPMIMPYIYGPPLYNDPNYTHDQRYNKSNRKNKSKKHKLTNKDEITELASEKS